MERMLNTTKPWVSCPALHKLGVVAHVYNPGMREMGSQKLKTSRKSQTKRKPRGKIAPCSPFPKNPVRKILLSHGTDEGEMACWVEGLGGQVCR